MKILLIGIDYFPEIGSGDKNFWYNMISYIRPFTDGISIISFNNYQKRICHQDSDIIIYNVNPIININRDRKCGNKFGFLNRSFSIFRNFELIKKIVNKDTIDIVHFMDNFGPINFYQSKNRCLYKKTITVMGSYPQSIIYNYALKLSINNFDKIIANSDTVFKKLLTIGIEQKKINMIRWGVSRSSGFLKINTSEIKNKLKINSNSKVILWSGFTQQTNFGDFISTLKIARKSVKYNPKLVFLFAFKPEHFKHSYYQFSSANIKILTNVKIFELYAVADLFVAPVSCTNSILAPPLTWLECSSYGVPIITTNVPGAAEFIKDGYNGFICNEEDIPDTILAFFNNQEKQNFSENTKEITNNKYDFEDCSKKYLMCWEDLLNE